MHWYLRATRLVLALTLLGVLPLASAQRPIPTAALTRGTLAFDGHASLGDFVGTTDSVRGAMSGGADLTAVRGWVEASVASLRTGNGKRDRDLRSSMETQTYPTMRFELTGVTPGEVHGDTTAVHLAGRLTLHGVTREVVLPATVVFGTGGVIRLRSDFPVNLKDYSIGGLSKMLGVLKMHENIEVHVDVTFAPS
jgi:polyisoprenoid-binding protein YceI